MRTIHVRLTVTEDAYQAVVKTTALDDSPKDRIQRAALEAVVKLVEQSERALRVRQLASEGIIEIGRPDQ